MPRVGFTPAISTFEPPKTVLASDRSAIEIGTLINMVPNKHYFQSIRVMNTTHSNVVNLTNLIMLSEETKNITWRWRK